MVGNQNTDLCIANNLIDLEEDLSKLLSLYFGTSFKEDIYYTLHHESDIHLNEVYSFASSIFNNPSEFLKQSQNLAKHLYFVSTHPQIKTGEFYVVYFKNCLVNNEQTDAIGLFKTETKDTFLQITLTDQNAQIHTEQGVNLKKVDKGAVIFNVDKESGYLVQIIDNTNKSAEARYWTDDFLNVKIKQDQYYNTDKTLQLCKKFITKELPSKYEMEKIDQVDLLNKSVNFFKTSDEFNINDFTNKVFEQEDVIQCFSDYKVQYEKEQEIKIADSFNISETAVKKTARSLKNVIKLDKNFHIYIHGDRNLIERGEDNIGKFYKVYYNEES